MHDIDRTQMEFGNAMESFEFTSEAGVFSENEQMELAAELLEITSEQEMDRFLGDLISKAGSAVGKFIGSPTGQALGGLLKGAAKKLLPMAGQALGGYIGGSTGAQLGGRLATAAGGALGLEAEQEDHEFEAAKSFVRLAGDAVKNAASAPATGSPRTAALQALTEAAKIHAPGLVSGAANGTQTQGNGMGRARTGRWMRRGSKIVLFGV